MRLTHDSRAAVAPYVNASSHPVTARFRTTLHIILAAAALIACGLPHDAAGSLDRIRGGVLRVGVTEHDPWIRHADHGPEGTEVRIIEALARGLHARPVYTWGNEGTILRAVERRELDLALGGLSTDSPWGAIVAFTAPYDDGATPGHVLALPPGENAWLVYVERALRAYREPPAHAAE